MSGLTAKTKGAFNQVSAFGQKFQGAMGHPAVQAVTATAKAVGEFGLEAVQTAGKIDASMNEVFTLLPKMTKKAMDEMTQEMIDLSVKTGTSIEDMTAGIYGALSSGIPKENVFTFMEEASKLSIAGVSSVDDAMASLTTVLNGYGMSADKAGQISDNLFTIVEGGVTTMPELATNLGKVASVANSVGVNFEELGAMVSTLTSKMGKGSTPAAMTKLKVMMDELGKAGTKVDKTFREIAGKGFVEFKKGGGTVAEALKMLEEHAGKTGGRISDLFGSAEAGSAALDLASDGMKKFTHELKQQANAAGASDKAFKKVDHGFARMMKKLMVGLEAFKYTVGKALGPVVDALMPMLQKGLKMISSLPWNSVGDMMGKIAKAYEPLQEAIFELVKEMFPLIPSLLKLLFTSIQVGMPIMVLVISILAKLMPILVWIVDKIASASEVVGTVYSWLTKLIRAVFNGPKAVKKALGEIEGEAGGLFKTVMGWWATIMGWGASLRKYFGITLTSISEMIDAVKYAADMLWTIVKWPFEQIWAFIVGLYDLVKITLVNAFDFIMGIRQRMIDKIFEIFPWLEGLLNWIKDKFYAVLEFHKKLVQAVIEHVKNKIKGFFEAIWSLIGDYVTGLWLMLKEKIDALTEKFMTSNSKIVEALRFFFLFAKEVFGVISGLVKKALGLFGKVGKAIGWVAKKLGLASEETEKLNKKVEKNEKLQKKTTEAVKETVTAKEKQAAAEEKIVAAQKEEYKQQENNFGLASMNQKVVEKTAKSQKQIALEAKMAALAKKEYVIAGAKIIKTSNVHIGQLNAAIKKHKGINNLGEAYQFIASGKMTPAQIIKEAFPEAEVLNAEGGKFSITNKKGQTAAEQIKSAVPEQEKLNKEAGNNPLLKLKKGEVKVTCTQKDNKDIQIIIQQIALVHRDLLGIDKTLKGKFVNQ